MKQGQLNTELNTEETIEHKVESGNTQIIERMEIEGTPFTAIRTEKGCFGTWGKVRLTDIMETIPEVEEMLTGFKWEVMLAVVIQVAETVAVDAIRAEKRKQILDGRTINDISKGGNTGKEEAGC